MSELIPIGPIRAHAEQAARDGKTVEACPYKDEPMRSELWLMYFNQEREKQFCAQ